MTAKLIEKNHMISSSKNDTVKILADYKMIKQMLRIFIDNSIKFTPKDGKIDISSILQNDNIKIVVSDTTLESLKMNSKKYLTGSTLLISLGQKKKAVQDLGSPSPNGLSLFIKGL